MGWLEYEDLPPGEEYVDRSIQSVRKIPEWRERIHIIPTTLSDGFLRKLVIFLSRENIPWVHWSESSQPGMRSLLSLPLKKWYAKLVNRHALGALAVCRNAMKDFGVWGIDLSRVAFLPYSPKGYDRDIDIDQKCFDFCLDRPAFLFLGSLVRRKGIDVILKAFARLSVISGSEKWVLILGGDDRSRGQYEKLASSLDLSQRVLFYGAIPLKRVPRVIKSAKVLLLPSRHDGWGVTLNEGASMGLALIGSDRAGASQHLIEPGCNGFIVKAGSVDDLSNAMVSYIRNESLADVHGARSLEIFDKYRPEANVARLTAILDLWMSSRNKPILA